MLPTPGADTARASLAQIARLGETPRFWRLQAHEAMWLGAAYDGRPSFWDGTVPLRERAPAVQSQIARTAGTRLTSLVFGERSFPAVTVLPESYGVDLSESDVSALSALVAEIVESSAVWRAETVDAGLRVAATYIACVVLRRATGHAGTVETTWQTLARTLVAQARYVCQRVAAL